MDRSEGRFVLGASHDQSERQRMEVPGEVEVMLRLHGKGWGSRRIVRGWG